MPLQPLTWILSGFSLSGLALAGAQVTHFSAAPAAMTANIGGSHDAVTTRVGAEALHISRSANGLFYVNGTVNGKDVRFAVDTGASVVVLNSTDAAHIGFATPNNGGMRIRTAAGYSRMHWHEAKNLAVEGKSLGSMDIAVMPDGPETSLLGLNALTRLHSITLVGDQLIIN